MRTHQTGCALLRKNASRQKSCRTRNFAVCLHSRIPHPLTPDSAPDGRFPQSLFRSPFCTTHAAVTSPLLDKRFSSRTECERGREIFREVFHTTKNFVLVCRLISFRNFLLSRATAPQSNGAFCTN